MKWMWVNIRQNLITGKSIGASPSLYFVFRLMFYWCKWSEAKLQAMPNPFGELETCEDKFAFFHQDLILSLVKVVCWLTHFIASLYWIKYAASYSPGSIFSPYLFLMWSRGTFWLHFNCHVWWCVCWIMPLKALQRGLTTGWAWLLEAAARQLSVCCGWCCVNHYGLHCHALFEDDNSFSCLFRQHPQHPPSPHTHRSHVHTNMTITSWQGSS